MTGLIRETAFLLRLPAAVAALAVLAVLSAVSVLLGLTEVGRQTRAIETVAALQAEDAAAIRPVATDAGSAAYYRFHATWDPPGPLAFAALGQRDVVLPLLRVRALALEGQIHETEAFNPELALPGRFDFAFVLIYVAPLILIALLHDLYSGEREAGRAAFLSALPRAGRRLWAPRVLVRAGAVSLALLLPFWTGAVLSGAAAPPLLAATGLVLALVLVWTGLSLLIGRAGWRSTTNAAALAALWFALTLVAPAGAGLAINAAIPLPQGADLLRENREAVHDAWDLDRNATLARFYRIHPEWADSAPMTRPFHWKWYFAFQHLGDVQVAETARAWQEGVARRERLADRISLLLPPIAVQRALHGLAGTDMAAHLAYMDRVRAYHARLRQHHYPYLFGERSFGAAGWDTTPVFTPEPHAGR